MKRGAPSLESRRIITSTTAPRYLSAGSVCDGPESWDDEVVTAVVMAEVLSTKLIVSEQDTSEARVQEPDVRRVRLEKDCEFVSEMVRGLWAPNIMKIDLHVGPIE